LRRSRREPEEKVVALDGTSPAALNNVAWAYAKMRPDRLALSMTMAEKAVKASPVSPQLADTLGWIYHLRGMKAKAIRSLECAASLMPRSPSVRYRLTKALLADGVWKR